MKQPPKRIFIEMAREEGEKDKRTVSRKDQLLKLYHESGWEGDELYSRLADLDEGALRRDKLYLYYSQHGKCMYSGEPIAFTQLDSDYDIDHIYPQSKTKDDSLNNRVLVKRGLNAQKSDSYPLSREIREKMRPYWEMLRSTKAISEEKFRRLVRVEPFHDDELAGFINRQLWKHVSQPSWLLNYCKDGIRNGPKLCMSKQAMFPLSGRISVWMQMVGKNRQRIAAKMKRQYKILCLSNA